MKVRGIYEDGVVRPMHPLHVPEHTVVEIVVPPEVEIDDAERARRKKVGEMHRKLEPIDIRPLTTEQIVREDRDSH